MYAYARRGCASLIVLVAPQRGWRRVTPTEHRATPDYAEQLRSLAEEAFPDATRIRLAQDNGSAHTLAALYATCPPDRAPPGPPLRGASHPQARQLAQHGRD